jgi:hypothetical protein
LLEISLDNFHANAELVTTYILESANKIITEIDYRTSDEGMSSANYFICAKNSYQSSWEAFITLFNYRLHFEEEWILANINRQDADNIANLWLKPELEKYDLTPLLASEIQEQTKWIIDGLTKLIVKNPAFTDQLNSPSHPKFTWPDQWGIYINRLLVSFPEKFTLPLLGQIESGTGLFLDWNLVEIFYETTDEYVLFSWGTAA